MISNLAEWMTPQMWFLVGGLTVILVSLIYLVDKKSKLKFVRGRKRPVP